MKQTLYDINNFNPITIKTRQNNSIEIRAINARSEYQDVLDLMTLTWEEDANSISTHFLKIGQYIGALLLGAFHDKKCVGMVYSSPTVIKGSAAHWSHRLAVDSNYRDSAIGKHLKLAQRDWCIANGFNNIYWSFDPMVSKNAHINLNKLECKACDFIENMYEDSNSSLHAGFATDRLIVRWDVVKNQKNKHVPLLQFNAEETSAIPSNHNEFKIIIPANSEALKKSDPDLYRELQSKCTDGFQFAIKHDLDVISFQKGVNEDTYIYVIGKLA